MGEPLDAGDVRAPGRTPPLRRTDAGGVIGRKAVDAATVASGARIKAGDRSRGPRRAVSLRWDQCRWRAWPRGPGREALNAPCRRTGTDAGAAIRREALDAGMVASGAGIKLGERSKMLQGVVGNRLIYRQSSK
jgi:hypothetical protein